VIFRLASDSRVRIFDGWHNVSRPSWPTWRGRQIELTPSVGRSGASATVADPIRVGEAGSGYA
jgi:hypothetical protein